MTTTQNQPARQPRPAARKDPFPAHLRRHRTVLTWLGLAGGFAGVVFTAVLRGRGQSVTAGILMVVIGSALAIAAQRPAAYRWFEWRPRQARPGQVVNVASTPPRRDRSGHLLPAAELGPEFRYIIRLIRHVADTGRGALLDKLTAAYDQIDWSEDLPGMQWNQFRVDVVKVRSIAQEWPGYHAGIKPRKVMRGQFDPANPGGFLTEMEQYSPYAAAVAALMLVRRDAEVTSKVFDTVMGPWTQVAGLPYRLGDVIWEVDEDRTYQPKPAGAPRQPRRVPHPGAALPAPGAIPAPRRPAPAPSPAAAAEDNPDIDLVVQAIELVLYCQFGSTAMLQRKLRLGFAAAGHLVDRLEKLGVLGPKADGQHTRQVMAGPAELDEFVAFARSQQHVR